MDKRLSVLAVAAEGAHRATELGEMYKIYRFNASMVYHGVWRFISYIGKLSWMPSRDWRMNKVGSDGA